MKAKIKDKITNLLKQGLEPKELTQSIIVSGLISTFPILGLCTIIITSVALKLKLNLPIMIALSYLMWPVQVLLIIPFIRVGEFIFFVPRSHHTIDQIITSFQNNFFQTLRQLSFELLCGVGGWIVTAIPVAVGIYWISLVFLKRVYKNQ